MLLLGRDDDDPLFLQFKEAQASVLEPFARPSEYENHGQRVVEGQRLMQAASDILLGWSATPGVDGVERDFYVRQLWDAKGSALIELMYPGALTFYARVCAWTLARAHARSGDPSRSRATSAAATRSTARSPSSPSCTRTRTSATTRRCRDAVPSRRVEAQPHLSGSVRRNRRLGRGVLVW